MIDDWYREVGGKFVVSGDRDVTGYNKKSHK
jgi:hypothetical protein